MQNKGVINGNGCSLRDNFLKVYNNYQVENHQGIKKIGRKQGIADVDTKSFTHDLI